MILAAKFYHCDRTKGLVRLKPVLIGHKTLSPDTHTSPRKATRLLNPDINLFISDLSWVQIQITGSACVRRVADSSPGLFKTDTFIFPR